MGGRHSNATYEYTLKSDNLADLKRWATRLADAMKGQPALIDVDIDQQESGVEMFVTSERDTASRLSISARDVQVPAKRVAVPGAANAAGAVAASAASASAVPDPGARDSASGQGLSMSATTMVPLPVIASFAEAAAATSISHQDGELATTSAFNLAARSSLSDAQAAVRQAEADIARDCRRRCCSGVPTSPPPNGGSRPRTSRSASPRRPR